MAREPAPSPRPRLWRWLVGTPPEGARRPSHAAPAPIRPGAAVGGDLAGWLVPTAVGLVAVAGVVLAGVMLGGRRGPVAFDNWALSALGSRGLGRADRITNLGSPAVLVGGALCCAAVAAAMRQGVVRAFACVAGPLLAAAVSQYMLKPAVNRRLFDVPTFPSGTVVVVAAVSCAAVLAVRGWGRPIVGAIGLALTGVTGAAVVALRWHFATDAVAGAVWGMGVVLLVDGVAHALGGGWSAHRATP